MNQCDATLLIAETLFVQTVKQAARTGLITEGRARAQCHARPRESDLLPRIYSVYSGIHYGRFYARGDLPDTEPPRRPAEYQAFRFGFQLVRNDLNSPSPKLG